MYRLYRESTRYVDGKYVKDLSHLNRDMSKVIIMDSNPEAFSMQPENGIPLRPFTGKPNDHGLLEYIPFLEGKKKTKKKREIKYLYAYKLTKSLIGSITKLGGMKY